MEIFSALYSYSIHPHMCRPLSYIRHHYIWFYNVGCYLQMIVTIKFRVSVFFQFSKIYFQDKENGVAEIGWLAFTSSIILNYKLGSEGIRV